MGANLQGQVQEKDRQLREMQLAVEDSDHLAKNVVQDWLSQKTDEIGDLQQRLSQEMLLRQDAQYKIIERERTICDLKIQLMRLQSQTDRTSTCPVSFPASARGVGGTLARKPEGE